MELNFLLTHMTQMKLNEEDTFDEDDNAWAELITLEGWGFWALASFINHSCFPNANCMVVGKALFIIATRKISPGEEIIVAYFQSLTPLATREQYCSHMGFRCQCKRCMFERSLGPEYKVLVEQIVTKYPMLAPHVPHVSRGDILALLELVLQLEEVDADCEGKQFIHASLISIYSLFAIFFPDISVLPHSLPTPMNVAEAIQHAFPGSDSAFNQYSRLVYEADGKQNDLLFQKLMEVGVTLIGKQEEHVLKALARTKMEEHWIKVSKVWDGSRM